jgi:hypothetical protein
MVLLARPHAGRGPKGLGSMWALAPYGAWAELGHVCNWTWVIYLGNPLGELLVDIVSGN